MYHKSVAGGHPRESLEASFDVVYEDSSRADLIEAETLMVASQVIKLLPARQLFLFGKVTIDTPLWYLRLSHTRLADAVLDLCNVPQKESIRRACLRVLSHFLSAQPASLVHFVKSRSRRIEKNEKKARIERLESILGEAVKENGLPKAAADSIREFIIACQPVDMDVSMCIDSMKKALASMRSMEKVTLEPRRAKRFEDAARSLKCIRDLTCTIAAVGLGPLMHRDSEVIHDSYLCKPLYISLDLGLRQRRKTYHGGTIFQCIILPDDYFDQPSSLDEDHDSLISFSGRGIKVAEGGNYSELVRRYRPPGNFASAVVNSYTSAPLPVCAGVRFSVGKFVELIYLDATLSGRRFLETWSNHDIDGQGIEALRKTLGHPFSFTKSVQCVIASVHGMDAASTPERFFVATKLWTEGISAEYLPQSNVMLSLLKRIHFDSSDGTGGSDWSLLELHGVCALLNIPFMIIVQPHLLKDKGSVRLRQVDCSSISSANNEMFVSLDDLAITIIGALTKKSYEKTDEPSASLVDTIPSSSRDPKVSRGSFVECIYVDNDHYFGNDRELSSRETPQWKSYMKVMKSIVVSAESYLACFQDTSSLSSALGVPCVPVFAVADVSFWVLRDFGTSLMRRERTEQSSVGACSEIIEKYGPKHKRSLRTLGVAIDNYMKRYGIWSSGNTGQTSHRAVSFSDSTLSGTSSSVLTALLYSKVDDRMDMISVHVAGRSNRHGHVRPRK